MFRRFLAVVAAVCVVGLWSPSAYAAIGWDVLIQDNNGEGGIGGQVNNMTEGETLLALGGASEASETIGVINYDGDGGNGTIGGDNPFPGGFNGTDDFALSASGYVTGIVGPGNTGTGVFRLNVNSDDGFVVKRNGADIGRFEGTRGPGTTTFDAQLTNGDFLEVQFFERSGGEEVEFFQTLESNTGSESELVGGSSTNVQIQTTAPAQSGVAAPLGWTAAVYNAASQTGIVGGTVDNMTEGDTLIDNGTINGMFMPLTVDAAPFPPNTNANDFAVEYTGYAQVIDGASGTFDLYVNSDDGFSLLVNGGEIARFEGTTGNSNTFINDLFLQDGDLITLRMFERGGGEKIDFFVDTDGDSGTGADRSHVGLTDSGLLISKVANIDIPEPSTCAVFGGLALCFGLAGWWRKRRTASV